MQEKKIIVGGIATRYFEGGPKDGRSIPIVLVHGGLFSQYGVCQNALVWERNLPGLAQEFRVIAFDTLGQGRTAAAAAASGYTLDAVIDHASAFLEAIGIKAAHLVGHDEGAVVAVRLAFRAPERVASCTIVNSPSLAPSGDGMSNFVLSNPPVPLYGRPSQRWFLERLSYTDHHVDAGSFLDEAVALADSETFTQVRGQLAEPGARDLLQRSTARIKGDTFALLNVQGFPVPALLIWGDDDPLSQLAHGRDWNVTALHRPAAYARSLFDLFARRQRLVQMKLMSRAGYMPFRERPELFNQMLASFVAGIGTPA